MKEIHGNKQQRKRNILVVLVLILLLGVGYVIPAAVMKAQDNRLELEVKSFQIQEIVLDFQNVNIVEELKLFADMLKESIVVEVSGEYTESFAEDAEKEQSGKLEDVKNSKEEAESEKHQSLKNCVLDFMEMLYIEDVVFQKFSIRNYVMMAATDDQRMYSVWECSGVDEEENKYLFWVDDITGKVMAFEMPFSRIDVSDESFYMAMGRIGEYYGFFSYGLGEYINLYKSKYWQNMLILYGEDGKEEALNLYIFKSGNTLNFNMYPGSVAVSESR